MDLPIVHLLGVPIHAVTMQEAVHYCNEAILSAHFRHVVTPNNEMLIEAQHNQQFFRVLQQADLLVPDSTGLLFGATLTGQQLKGRVRGVDLLENFCMQAPKQANIFLLGAGPGVAAKAAAVLVAKNPALQIVGTFSGSPKQKDAAEIIKCINDSGANVLFVAYGAPAQDMWIAKYAKDMPNVRLAMGIGGSFDFIAGTVRRAPRILRVVGLEWCWRLLLQPKRYKRIFNAVIIFPYLVMRYGKNPTIKPVH